MHVVLLKKKEVNVFKTIERGCVENLLKF